MNASNNNNGKAQGPQGGGRRPGAQRQGQPRHGGGQQRGPSHGQDQRAQGRHQRDTSTLGIRKEEPRKALPVVDCAICHKPIFDLAGALGDKDTNEPVHFDCALERVAAAETLAQGEKVVYLGAGCFAVVGFKNGSEGAFVVKRRIRWEREGEKQAWRKDISSYIAKI
ncbi:hypothetical protein LWX53_08650 [bacterium]|nr:hypothetical protein [bacterium]